MTPGLPDFLALAARVAADTAAYLFAYFLAPLWALAVMIALLALGRRLPFGRWLRSSGAGVRIGAPLLLGLTRPFGRRGLEDGLRRLEGRGPLPIASYLASSHGLTPYYLLLLGPLLGKDVLLSHLIGGLLFVPAVAGAARWAGAASGPEAASGSASVEPAGGGGAGNEAGSGAAGPLGLLGGEAARFLGFGAHGLALGALVGAAGLSSPSFFLLDVPLGPPGNQPAHALLAALLSPATFLWPVGNLFVGTYLWKLGLAHAGLVAFLWAAPASPQRVRVYARLWGRKRALRWAGALLAGAALAGIGTALLYSVTPLGIVYKLDPSQMWGW